MSNNNLPNIVNISATNAGTTELVAAQTPIESLVGVGGQGQIIFGTLFLTGNASASTVTVRVRQGTGAAGTLVGSSGAVTVAAAAVVAVPFSFMDASAAATNPATYAITVQPSLALGAAGLITGAACVVAGTDED